MGYVQLTYSVQARQALATTLPLCALSMYTDLFSAVLNRVISIVANLGLRNSLRFWEKHGECEVWGGKGL